MSMSDRDEYSDLPRNDRGAGNDLLEGELDEFVLAFEEAYQVRGEADLADFLPPRDHPLHAAVLRELVRVDLEFRWERGCPKDLEQYQRAFPSLAEDREGLRAIAYEEYRLRRQAGHAATAGEYRERYGLSLVSMTGRSGAPFVQRLDDLDADDLDADDWDLGDAYPRVGDVFLDFQLDRELGRGAFGRVFLARQADLNDRPVVLKLTTARQDEARTLAQLQHENIVPVYSRQHHLGYRAVCMPYLGGVTLREVLQDLKAQGGLPGSGLGLLSSLDKSVEAKAGAARVDPPQAAPRRLAATRRRPNLADALGRSPRRHERDADAADPASAGATRAEVPEARAEARQRLARLTYVEAVLWMISRLAHGLSHAHGKGILHLDLKPANILLTEEGRPLLLDFNLAADLKRDETRAAAGVGGTLPYMAPEHLRAFLGLKVSGPGQANRIDARCDLYALGVIAFEMLTGRPPFPIREGTRDQVVRTMIADRQAAPPRLRPWNPTVSPASEAIIRRCLESDPDRRYPSAEALFEDLQRQLSNRPLRHTPEPSRVERAGKWVRRHARLLSIATVVLVGLGALAGVAAAMASRQETLDRLAADQAMDRFQEWSMTARTQRALWENEPPRVSSTLVLAHDALKMVGALDGPPAARWWEHAPAAIAAPDEVPALRQEAGELFLLVAAAKLKMLETATNDRGALLLQASLANERAEHAFQFQHGPRQLWTQRAKILLAQGEPDAARRAEERARAAPLTTARDFAIEGDALVDLGRLRDALQRFDEAKDRDPRDYSAWLGKGYCHLKLAQFGQALTAFTACIAIDDRNADGWFNRGSVLLRMRQADRAAIDLTRALELRPDNPEIQVHLGIALLETGNAADAEELFGKVLGIPSTTPRVYLMRARARIALNDQAGAEADLAEGLRRTPDDEKGWTARALARSRHRGDHLGALADLDEALERFPDSYVAMNNKSALLANELKRPADAIAVLDRLLERFPDHAPARGSRGVLHARLGHREQALADARTALALSPRQDIFYYAACIWSLTSRENPADAAEALRLLGSALAGGFGFDLVPTDPDLDPIRQHANFATVVEEARLNQARSALPASTDDSR